MMMVVNAAQQQIINIPQYYSNNSNNNNPPKSLIIAYQTLLLFRAAHKISFPLSSSFYCKYYTLTLSTLMAEGDLLVLIRRGSSAFGSCCC